MEPGRPDPDALLRKVQEEEAARAPLKIFFGAAPGVGKTYAMLQEARARQAAGTEVVVGVVETHGREETAALVEGLEVMPRKELPYMGKFLPEFDLEAALKRRPQLILMDELAHSNVMGSRHAKRWQDVMELLDAGIEVYSTLNVQHLESLKDVMAQITGIVVRENVPDTVLERADAVELVDIPPEELQQRLKEGKVYLPEQARHALDRFFRRGNLLALRELALRRTADRVDADMRRYMAEEGIEKTWAAGERLMVCVGPSPLSTRLIRATRRMAEALGAPWVAVYVETTRHLRYSEADQHALAENLRLAERLGGETVTIQGERRIAEDLLALARSRNVTKIVLGKPTRSRVMELFTGSLMDELVRGSGDIDVYVITGDPEKEAARPKLQRSPAGTPWTGYLSAAVVVVLATLIGHLTFRRLDLADLVMLYLLGIVVVAARYGRAPSLLASVLSVAAFDFFFVPPFYTFAVSDFRHVGTFGILLVVGILVGTLTDRLRQQGQLARAREQRTQALYKLSRELASASESAPLVESAVRNVATQFHSRALVLLPDEKGRLRNADPGAEFLNEAELAVAQWVFEHQEPAGQGTDTLPGAKATYLPLKSPTGNVGVLGIQPEGTPRWLDPDQRALLEAFANQAALALERVLLGEQRAVVEREMAQEQMRNALLSSVSHDLRTPLGSITGSASALLEGGEQMSPEVRRDLLLAIQEEAQRLHRLVTNLLDLTRLESGALQVHKAWTPLEEVVGAALNRLEKALQQHPVRVVIPEDLPLVPLDEVLFQQVLLNLLENAVKYAPPGSPIAIRAWATPRSVQLVVADRGPGIAPGDEERIFEKLVRGREAAGPVGAGLGLAICRGIVAAHGGRIEALNRRKGGAKFLVTLPLEGAPPPAPSEP